MALHGVGLSLGSLDALDRDFVYSVFACFSNQELNPTCPLCANASKCAVAALGRRESRLA